MDNRSKLEGKTLFYMELFLGIAAIAFFLKWRIEIDKSKELKRQINYLIDRFANKIWIPGKKYREEREQILKELESDYKDYDDLEDIPGGKELLGKIYKEASEKNQRLTESGW